MATSKIFNGAKYPGSLFYEERLGYRKISAIAIVVAIANIYPWACLRMHHPAVWNPISSLSKGRNWIRHEKCTAGLK